MRDIELTPRQQQRLIDRQSGQAIVERRRQTRLKNEERRKQAIVDEAKMEIKSLSQKELFLIGIALYWGEGGKTKGIVRFSNSDSKMIEVMMEFFRKICETPEKKFRGYIHIHQHLNYRKAEKYWSAISAIPLKQFYKTYRKPNKSSQNKKDSLPLGTFDIYICDTRLLLRMKGWSEKIHELSTHQTK